MIHSVAIHAKNYIAISFMAAIFAVISSCTISLVSFPINTGESSCNYYAPSNPPVEGPNTKSSKLDPKSKKCSIFSSEFINIHHNLWFTITIITLLYAIINHHAKKTKIRSIYSENNELLNKIHYLKSELTNSTISLQQMGMTINTLHQKLFLISHENIEMQKELDSLKSEISRAHVSNNCLEKTLEKLQKLEINSQLQIKELKTQLSDSNILNDIRLETINKSNEIIARSITEQYRLLDMLASKYYDIQGHIYERKEMYKEIMKILSSMKPDSETVKYFEEMINKRLNNLMISFRKDFPEMSKNDITLYILSVLKFSTKSICLFFDIQTTKCYNRRSALRKKIMDNQVVGSPRYLEYL